MTAYFSKKFDDTILCNVVGSNFIYTIHTYRMRRTSCGSYCRVNVVNLKL